jgi:AcrR family transcriptional regulator
VTDTEKNSDGRRQRSETSRQKIVAAMLFVVRSGVISPSAEEVAARAKVGLRTVFRHFDNLDSLYREMDDAMKAEILPIVERPYASREWRGQLNELMARRADIFERIMPIRIAADVHRHQSAFLETEGRAMTKYQRSALANILPKEFQRDAARFEALDLILSFETWRRLRKDQGLSPARAKKVVAETATLLLAR